MSVAVCRGSFSPFESILMPNIAREPLPISPITWQPPAEKDKPTEDDDRPGQFDIWSSIQSLKAKEAAAAADTPAPYVHPLVRRSSSLMSQKSLEICTESLGSETGSAGFSSLLDDLDFFSPKSEAEEEEHHPPPIHGTPVADEEEGPRYRVAKAVEERRVQSERKKLASVNYHCSISRRSPPRSFPPPLPSISRRDGPCILMRPHRRDGRLVVEAVTAPSQNYLHAQRQDGRLLLSFIDATFDDPDDIEIDTPDAAQEEEDAIESKAEEDAIEEEEEEAVAMAQEEEGELEEGKNCYEEEEEDEEEEVEEEVEVVDRGTVVEVKVSTQPQQQSGAMKMQRSSSFVINKFVGAGETRWAEKMAECKPTAPDKRQIQQDHRNPGTAPPAPARRAAPTTTTAAAAAAAASTFSTSSEGYYSSSGGSNHCSFHGWGPQVVGGGGGQYASVGDHKLLFTSKRRNWEELLHHMRRCSLLRRPLFILEPCCIATSS